MCSTPAAPEPQDHTALVAEPDGTPEVVTFSASTQSQVENKVEELAETSQVLAVEQDQPVTALSVSPGDDSYYTQQWGFDSSKMNFNAAWNTNNVDGSGVRVAVIDTGVSATHPDLAANVVQGKDFVETSGQASQNATIDGNGHGTHVAGIVAAADNAIGVVGGAPHATVVPVRVLDCNGSGAYSAVAAGILWASDSIANGGGGAQVINLSLGGLASSSVMQNAINTAIARGTVVVAAAGNCGQGGSTCNNQSNAPVYPGAYSEVLTVGAIQQSGAKATYSNNNTYVDVAAPGSGVPSTWPSVTGSGHCLAGTQYECLNGTSMATPHVAALAALVKQQCGLSYAVTQVIAKITSTVGPAISGFASSVGLARPDVATALPVSCP